MVRSYWTRQFGWMGALLFALVSGAWAQAQDVPVRVLRVQAERVRDYWLGVECRRELDETLRAQLDLEEGVGLIVHDIAPNSPAAEAGLQPHDILLAAGEDTLRSLEDLTRHVEKGEKFALELLRNAQRQNIEVTPAERPAPRELIERLQEGDRDLVFKWLQDTQPQMALPHRFHIWRPSGGPRRPLPDDVSITITRRGSKAAKVKVERGDESWDLQANQLDELPADLRGPVADALGSSGPVRVTRELRTSDPLEQVNERIEALEQKLDKVLERLPQE